LNLVKLLALAALLLAIAPGAGAQTPTQTARVAVLSIGVAPPPEEVERSPFITSLRDLGLALRDLGWVRGQNLVFEARYADGDADRLPAMAADLVRLKVDLIVALSNQAAQAAKRATSSIPIVILFGVAPIEAGLVTSLASPGGNVTGTTVAPVAFTKHLTLLKEAVPKLKRVAVLWDLRFPGLAVQEASDAEARTVGLTVAQIEVQRPEAMDAALVQVTREQAGALFVIPSGPVAAAIPVIIAFAAQHRIPTCFPTARWAVDAGGLMSYGFDSSALLRRSASYIDRILRGTRPAALPVERPMTLELAINLRTAKVLGLTIPPSLLQRADYVMRTAEPPVAWRCAVALLDRGYGRPVTSLEGDLRLASPLATAMSWHDELLARAMMCLPDRVTGWPPLLPMRGHELECFQTGSRALGSAGRRISPRRSSKPSQRGSGSKAGRIRARSGHGASAITLSHCIPKTGTATASSVSRGASSVREWPALGRTSQLATNYFPGASVSRAGGPPCVFAGQQSK
jgi:putative ABC transport system substrate-binding protein